MKCGFYIKKTHSGKSNSVITPVFHTTFNTLISVVVLNVQTRYVACCIQMWYGRYSRI